MKPNGGALGEAEGVEGIAAAAMVLVDGTIADAAQVVENLRGIETLGVLRFEQPDGVGEIVALGLGGEVAEGGDYLQGHRLGELPKADQANGGVGKAEALRVSR